MASSETRYTIQTPNPRRIFQVSIRLTAGSTAKLRKIEISRTTSNERSARTAPVPMYTTTQPSQNSAIAFTIQRGTEELAFSPLSATLPSPSAPVSPASSGVIDADATTKRTTIRGCSQYTNPVARWLL